MTRGTKVCGITVIAVTIAESTVMTSVTIAESK